MPKRSALAILPAMTVLACTTVPLEPVLEGTWGGPDASMVLTSDGGELSYSCGAGTIDAGWTLTASGAFSAMGVHYFGGGPVSQEGRPPHDAVYEGQLEGDVLTLSVTIADPATNLGPFELVRDGSPVTDICY